VWFITGASRGLGRAAVVDAVARAVGHFGRLDIAFDVQNRVRARLLHLLRGPELVLRPRCSLG
jgi:hypothetical protein